MTGVLKVKVDGVWVPVEEPPVATPEQMVFLNFTKTTSASGQITVTAAELGLTTVNGAICGVQWNTAGTITRGSARLMSGATAVATGGDSVSVEVTSRTGTVVNAAAVVFWIIAWGVPT